MTRRPAASKRLLRTLGQRQLMYALLVLSLAGCGRSAPLASRGQMDSGQDAADPRYESRFVDVGGIRLHYLDFGGEGLPIVFVHSESWNAHTYEGFAPRFTDANRVLAVTRPGYGESAAHPDGFDVGAQAESLIEFLDALGIERAVFAGNSSPTVHLTYLAEHHPDRVAGVIYLAGLLTPWLREVRDSDPAGAGLMASRASAPDGLARERHEALFSYRPEFVAGDRPPIEVPALAFAGRSGTIGHERFSEPLAVVGSALMADFFAELPPSPFRDYFQRLIDDPDFRSESLRVIEDPAAREFLLRLAEDIELQAQVWRYQLETAGPAVLAGQERFRRAFDRLRLVPLDVSTVYGYEFRESPELIEPHIRRFLAELEPVGEGPQDTNRYTVIVAGQPAGERLSWAESADTWRYFARGPPSGVCRTSRIVLDPEGPATPDGDLGAEEPDGDLGGAIPSPCRESPRGRGVASWLDFQYTHSRPFIEEVKRVEATRPPAPTGG